MVEVKEIRRVVQITHPTNDGHYFTVEFHKDGKMDLFLWEPVNGGSAAPMSTPLFNFDKPDDVEVTLDAIKHEIQTWREANGNK